MKEEIYKLTELAINANRKATNNGNCHTCFCVLAKNYLDDSDLILSYLEWRKRTRYTSCASILFYLQDLGIIKILSGVIPKSNANAVYSRVDCGHLKYIINKQGNKI